eukprot:jgi/Mesen1/8870/ME000530S08277
MPLNKARATDAVTLLDDFVKTGPLPQLLVFDLDYTLWPFWCECRSKHDVPRLYSEARCVIDAVHAKSVLMAVASRTPTPDIAQSFLDKLGLASLFSPQEIYPSWTHKTEHFKVIHEKTGVPYSAMLFFDDEDRNINAVAKMGVTCVLVNDGLTVGALKEGLLKYAASLKPDPR